METAIIISLISLLISIIALCTNVLNYLHGNFLGFTERQKSKNLERKKKNEAEKINKSFIRKKKTLMLVCNAYLNDQTKILLQQLNIEFEIFKKMFDIDYILDLSDIRDSIKEEIPLHQMVDENVWNERNNKNRKQKVQNYIEFLQKFERKEINIR